MHTATCLVCTNEMPDNYDSVVWTKRSSLHRCPPGCIAFNLMYEQVWRGARAADEEKGIWTEFRYHPAQPLWNVSPEAKAGSLLCWPMSRLWTTHVFFRS